MQIDIRRVGAANGDNKKAINRIVRDEFIEMIPRIAIGKYLKPMICPDAPSAVQKLMDEHIIPYISIINSEKFRQERYLNEDVDRALQS